METEKIKIISQVNSMSAEPQPPMHHPEEVPGFSQPHPHVAPLDLESEMDAWLLRAHALLDGG